MAVLQTYHKLVERDAKNVDIHWKVISIVLLLFAIIGSFGISISLNKIVTAFEGKCPLNANLLFETEAERLFYETGIRMKPESENISARLQLDVTAEKQFAVLSDVFNESYSKFLQQSDAPLEYPTNQVQFLSQNLISDVQSVWGTKSSCELGIFMPICQSFFGIIMAMMFVICGKGGKSDPNSFLSKPWRIVTPACVFSLIMTILAIVNLSTVQGGMNNFCDSFESAMPDIPCDVAINRYMTVGLNQIALAPSIYRQILSAFTIITFIFWLASLLVLLARILLVIDFQLVRVTVKSVEYENANEKSNLQVVETVENGEYLTNGAPIATTEC